MITKTAISQIRLLHHKKHRDAQEVFIVEGVKSCLETLQSDYEIVQCYVTEDYTANRIPQSAKRISQIEMSRISCLSTPPEILCIVKKQHFQIDDIDATNPLLVLDSIRDPGNLGTIIRTADWFGFNQILCSEDCVEFTNPKVIQATMGSFTRVKVIYNNLPNYLKTETHRNILGLYMNGKSIQNQSFNNNDMVIIGSESHGISEAVAPYIHTKITIPVCSHEPTRPDSLNAAIAAGIFMYTFKNGELKIEN